MRIVFTSEISTQRTDEIVSYMLGPRLWIPQVDYPDFDTWAQKVHTQLKRGGKRSLVALVNGQVVGVVVYQRHTNYPNTLEIKNITVRPDQRGRHIASFMLRNAEIEGVQDFQASSVILDAKASNTSFRVFVIGQRYRPMAEMDLYGLGSGKDVVYRKALSRYVL